MHAKVLKGAVLVAAFATAGTAVAATSNPAGVSLHSLEGVQHALRSDGSLKHNAVGNLQIKNHAIDCSKLVASLCAARAGLRGPAGPAGPAGLAGQQGAPGVDGATGATGPQGIQGPRGPQAVFDGTNGADGAAGPKGDTGATGSKGDKGDKGDQGIPGTPAPTLDFGVANVLVSRGVAAPSIWAQYATGLGSPVGNNATGGSFRFTCSAAKAPCTISVTAAVLGSADHTLYPRLLVYNAGDGNGQASPLTTCEYADGSTGAAPKTVTHQASTASPMYTAVPVNIGSTDDCGLNGATGDVTQITVPNGYYDVHSTFTFS